MSLIVRQMEIVWISTYVDVTLGTMDLHATRRLVNLSDIAQVSVFQCLYTANSKRVVPRKYKI